MMGGVESGVLKAVSRSFYLSLRFLPVRMRRAASVAYLLARASDTIADTAGVGVEVRLGYLADFLREVECVGAGVCFSKEFLAGVLDVGERELLVRNGEVLAGLGELSAAERGLVCELMRVVVDGQRGDLEVFGDGGGCLVGDEGLEEYCWKVAGCVGVFWTRLGFETLGGDFSDGDEEVLLGYAVRYGKGLQLVNILRDLEEDLGDGRCYLPVEDSSDEVALLAEFERWRKVAVEYVGCGREYSRLMKMRRLRLASGLPGVIAEDTLRMLEGVSLGELEVGVKVPRRRVYWYVLTTFFSG